MRNRAWRMAMRQGLSRRRAVFLDRDGVIIENRPDYVLSWADVEFLPGVFEAVQRLAYTPFAVVIVTNQSPVGRGLMTASTLSQINRRIISHLEAHGGRIEAIYVCPHRPDEGCSCRKPQPGLLLQAAEKLNLDLGHSYMVGDAVSDVKAALAVGARPIMVRTGRGLAQLPLLRQAGHDHVPVAANLAEAIDWILEWENARPEG